jgi:hypothetical protein
MDYSRDAIRLLYAVSAYTPLRDNIPGSRWLKVNTLYVIALSGIKSGAFSDYDLAPTLFPFRGIKMFAMVSQEAAEDINTFFKDGLIEKILLNTWFYATITGVRITKKGLQVLSEHLKDEDKKVIDPLIYCADCSCLVDFAVSIEQKPDIHLQMNRVCPHRAKGLHNRDDYWTKKIKKDVIPITDFFSIGDVEYKSKAFFL